MMPWTSYEGLMYILFHLCAHGDEKLKKCFTDTTYFVYTQWAHSN